MRGFFAALRMTSVVGVVINGKRMTPEAILFLLLFWLHYALTDSWALVALASLAAREALLRCERSFMKSFASE